MLTCLDRLWKSFVIELNFIKSKAIIKNIKQVINYILILLLKLNLILFSSSLRISNVKKRKDCFTKGFFNKWNMVFLTKKKKKTLSHTHTYC